MYQFVLAKRQVQIIKWNLGIIKPKLRTRNQSLCRGKWAYRYWEPEFKTAEWNSYQIEQKMWKRNLRYEVSNRWENPLNK